MKDKIIVVGGYGAVGQIVCKKLALDYPGMVYAAGRSLEKANDFSIQTKDRVKPMVIDITKPVLKESLKDVKLIIMCLDQPNTEFIQKVLDMGIDYLDITAGYDFLLQVEGLNKKAVLGGATALLSVGLTPGLSNLMVLEASRQLDSVDSVDIFVMLGVGDKHGSAAIKWTLDHLNKDIFHINNGKVIKTPCFSEGRVVSFGKEFGQKKAYRFPFSDQHTVARTLSIPVVKTRLCFDSTLITRGLSLIRKVFGFGILKKPVVSRLAEKAMSKIPFGSDRYALKVEAYGILGGKDTIVEYLIEGRKEAVITGTITSAAAKKLYEGEFNKGVYHIEQLFDLSILPIDINDKIKKTMHVNK